MAKTLDDLSQRAALVTAAKDFHTRGWMLGTAGNLSTRDNTNKDTFWITASALPKGCLDENDFLNIEIASGNILLSGHPDIKPSAETAIHQTIYKKFPHANCCMHVHSIDAAVAISKHAPQESSLRLPELEMLKGFGIWEEKPTIDLAIFPNHLEVSKIAQDIENYFVSTTPQIDALMIRNHGITVWGASIQEAYNRVEIAEFILSYMARI